MIVRKMLMEIRNELQGNVKVLFQAAEETAIGAKYYLEQGLLNGVDTAYGCHTVGWQDTGTIAVNPGPRSAGTDAFSIHVQGVGGLSGMPHQGKDALVAACSLVMNLQTMVSRMMNPIDTLVVTIEMTHSGSCYNSVADSAQFTGTARTYSNEVQLKAPEQMRQVAESTAAAFGCAATVDYQFKTEPVVHDNAQINRLTHDAVVKLFGEDTLRESSPIGGGDDFACFSERVPGMYAFIGTAKASEGGLVHAHHHPKVCFDENSMKMGIAMYVQMAANYLSDK